MDLGQIFKEATELIREADVQSADGRHTTLGDRPDGVRNEAQASDEIEIMRAREEAKAKEEAEAAFRQGALQALRASEKREMRVRLEARASFEEARNNYWVATGKEPAFTSEDAHNMAEKGELTKVKIIQKMTDKNNSGGMSPEAMERQMAVLDRAFHDGGGENVNSDNADNTNSKDNEGNDKIDNSIDRRTFENLSEE